MSNGWKNDYLRYRDFFLNIVRIYQSKPNVKSFLEITLSLSTIVIFSIFAIRPTLLTITGLSQEIKGKEETLFKLNEKITNLQNASLVLEQEADSLPYIIQAVPIQADIDGAIGQIQGISLQNSVQILGISSSEVNLYGEPDNKKAGESSLPQNSGELPITLSVTGSYLNLNNFLSTIENTRRPIKIDSFALNAGRVDSGIVLVLVITGRLPYLAK